MVKYIVGITKTHKQQRLKSNQPTRPIKQVITFLIDFLLEKLHFSWEYNILRASS